MYSVVYFRFVPSLLLCVVGVVFCSSGCVLLVGCCVCCVVLRCVVLS